MKDGKQCVLLVDDSKGIVNFLTLKLKLSGYEVICSSDGEKGLELARETNPDIILLDVAMPGTDGIEVLRRLRQFSKVPVIVLSARDCKSEEAMSIGATAFVSKPFNPDELISKIKVSLQSSCTR